MNDIMKKYLEKMKALQESELDEEILHPKADDLLCEIISEQLGDCCKEIVAIFESLPKWYA